MKQKIIILAVIIFSSLLIAFLWWKQAVKAPNPTDQKTVSFTIKQGEDSKSIAEHLEEAGLIRSKMAFFLLARFGNLGQNIQAGEFRLNPSMDLLTLSQNLTHGTSDTSITIPEGYRNSEIALKLAKEFSIPEAEFTQKAKEGFMFPDTYQIPKDATTAAIIDVFMKNFQKKVTPEIQSKAKSKNLTLDELITIASLVEREARLKEDRPLVASVILNRKNIDMKLDIDATIQYALGYQPKEKTWWKKDLTLEDLEIDSPYNTYKNPGLPPGPIANPGLAAIQAVIDAPNNDYLFYVADSSGKSHFAKDFEEHNANIAKYLNK